MRVPRFLMDNAFGIAVFLILLPLAIGVAGWLQKPGMFAKSHYVECLQVVLVKGTIEDAESMCKDLRYKETQ